MRKKLTLVHQLQKNKVEFGPALSESQLQHIESLLNAPLPSEYRQLLCLGMPVANRSNWNAFPDWSDPEKTVNESQKLIEDAFTFDIEHARYWHPILGDRPNDVENAKEQALAVVRQWPPLVRIYSHRYMPTTPHRAGNPVISFRQVSDAVYYGYDFEDYLEKEFHIAIPGKHKNTPSTFSPWSEVFFGEEGTNYLTGEELG